MATGRYVTDLDTGDVLGEAPAHDVLDGRGGDDELRFGAGADEVHGGPGNDGGYGSRSDARIDLGPGDDGIGLGVDDVVAAHVACGDGADRIVSIGPGDAFAADCEAIVVDGVDVHGLTLNPARDALAATFSTPPAKPDPNAPPPPCTIELAVRSADGAELGRGTVAYDSAGAALAVAFGAPASAASELQLGLAYDRGCRPKRHSYDKPFGTTLSGPFRFGPL